MPIFRYENYNIDYEITQKRKNQKNIILRFRDGFLTVSAPKKATLLQIETVLRQHVAWIQSRQSTLPKRQVHDASPNLHVKEVYLFGRSYPVKLIQMTELVIPLQEKFIFSETHACIFVPKFMEHTSENLNAYIHNVIYECLFSLAKKTIPKLVIKLGTQFDLNPARVMVKEQRSRWGSCSVNGSIYMNWRLIQAPKEVIKYVAVHELAHLQEHNHSNRFWRLVEQMMPEYKIQREWLKKNGEKLFFIHR